MVTATRQVPVTSEGQFYAVHIVESVTQIRGLINTEKTFLNACESTLRPEFFLASASNNDWLPRVAVVTHGGVLRGILYAKEKRVGIVPTGLLYVDTTLCNMPIVDENEREAVFRAALETLLKRRGVLGLRLLLPPGGAEMAGTQGIPSAIPVDLCYAPAQNHSQLMLPNHYETFLESLGHQTRRNFRYYRRRSEAANVKFIDKLSIDEFASAASTLQNETLIKSGSKAIKRAIEMISATERPLLVGLRHRDGEWLSILGGWYESDRAVIFLQMNSDRRHRNASLSIVLRGYLLEWFILRGVKKVVFWAGSGGQLSRYAEYIPSIAVHLDKQSFLWKAVRHIVAPLISLLPGPVANLAQWIVPRTHQQNFDPDAGS